MAPTCGAAVPAAAVQSFDAAVPQAHLRSAGIHARRRRVRRPTTPRDRKSVVSGKRVSVRVDLGSRRIIKQNMTPLVRAHNSSQAHTHAATARTSDTNQQNIHDKEESIK